MNNHFDEERLVSNPKPTGDVQAEDAAFLQAARLTNAVAFPMILRAALELGVIDIISAAGDGAWLSSAEIASQLSIKPTNPQASRFLDRMLRVLTSYSVLKCRTVPTGDSHLVYGTEPVCRFFLTGDGGSGSFASLFMLSHSDVIIDTWKHVKVIMKEGEDAFSSAHGMRLFEYIGSNDQFGELFNRSMSESSLLIMKRVLEVYRGFEDVNVLVDVGGGLGTVLGIITSKYPQIKAINFDLPSVVPNSSSHPAGVEHVGGDMFVDVPEGDAIFMERILHDWTDEDCIKILKNCWKALPEKKGKVIIVDIVLPEEPKSGDVCSNVAFDFDMLMLSQCSGGKERTRAQFHRLASASGFTGCYFFSCASLYWVIEFHK